MMNQNTVYIDIHHFQHTATDQASLREPPRKSSSGECTITRNVSPQHSTAPAVWQARDPSSTSGQHTSPTLHQPLEMARGLGRALAPCPDLRAFFAARSGSLGLAVPSRADLDGPRKPPFRNRIVELDAPGSVDRSRTCRPSSAPTLGPSPHPDHTEASVQRCMRPCTRR